MKESDEIARRGSEETIRSSREELLNRIEGAYIEVNKFAQTELQKIAEAKAEQDRLQQAREKEVLDDEIFRALLNRLLRNPDDYKQILILMNAAFGKFGEDDLQKLLLTQYQNTQIFEREKEETYSKIKGDPSLKALGDEYWRCKKNKVEMISGFEQKVIETLVARYSDGQNNETVGNLVRRAIKKEIKNRGKKNNGR